MEPWLKTTNRPSRSPLKRQAVRDAAVGGLLGASVGVAARAVEAAESASRASRSQAGAAMSSRSSSTTTPRKPRCLHRDLILRPGGVKAAHLNHPDKRRHSAGQPPLRPVGRVSIANDDRTLRESDVALPPADNTEV